MSKSRPRMREIDPDCGDLISIVAFRLAVEHGGFIDYDGYGNLATDKAVSDIEIRPSIFLDMPLPDWATHVLWYNR